MRNLFVYHRVALLVVASLVACGASQPAEASSPLPDKQPAACLKMVNAWVGRAFGAPKAVIGQSPGRLNVPFSFKNDGKLPCSSL